jgi:hypothetical protein
MRSHYLLRKLSLDHIATTSGALLCVRLSKKLSMVLFVLVFVFVFVLGTAVRSSRFRYNLALLASAN